MSQIDWIVLVLTLTLIVLYGVYRSRGTQNVEDYLVAGKSLPWYHVCLSVMATQASAITFLSGPGQGFSNGMGFVQFYLGLPLAMVVLSITFVPIFHRLKVYTAYEFLEKRFDIRVRILTVILFLFSRGLATGVSIYAPSIILATILGLDITYTNIFMGLVVLIYTVSGGTKAISHTHVQQMLIVTVSMVIAGCMIVHLLPADVGLVDALKVAGKAGRMNTIDFEFNPNSRYNIWSGLIGGFFLQLSYFGTDQSQVGRYLTGHSIGESRLGLIMNGLLKIPMQFLIVMLGVLLFVFYSYNSAPLFFNKTEVEKLRASQYEPQLTAIESDYTKITVAKKQTVTNLQTALSQDDKSKIDLYQTQIQAQDKATKSLKASLTALIKQNNPAADAEDRDYVFLNFVLENLPVGLIGLLMAVIFSASMGSIASAYTSLASTTVIDVYKRIYKPHLSDQQTLIASRWATVFWGIACVFFAQFASRFGNLLEGVNIIGSLFYGVILGIFCVAFYFKSIGGRATFIAAILTEIVVIICWQTEIMAFLWLNVLGCLLVILIGWLVEVTRRRQYWQ
jgi:solute carrier family 5 (sodium-dependent multivitamin transporter), member 6